MQDGEPNVYGGICTLLNGDSQGQRTRMHIFLTYNAIAVPIAFGASAAVTEEVKVFISAVATLMHIGLVAATIQGVWLIRYWDKALAELERQDQDKESTKVRVKIFSNPEFIRRRGTLVRYVYTIPFGSFVLIWGWKFWDVTSHTASTLFR